MAKWATMNKETVTTWADHYGRWYARVSGVKGAEQESVRVRGKARRAMRAEILMREAGPIKPTYIEVFETDKDSITYRERVDR